MPVSATANDIKDSQKSSQKIIELIQENPSVTSISSRTSRASITSRSSNSWEFCSKCELLEGIFVYLSRNV